MQLTTDTFDKIRQEARPPRQLAADLIGHRGTQAAGLGVVLLAALQALGAVDAGAATEGTGWLVSGLSGLLERLGVAGTGTLGGLLLLAQGLARRLALRGAQLDRLDEAQRVGLQTLANIQQSAAQITAGIDRLTSATPFEGGVVELDRDREGRGGREAEIDIPPPPVSLALERVGHLGTMCDETQLQVDKVADYGVETREKLEATDSVCAALNDSLDHLESGTAKHVSRINKALADIPFDAKRGLGRALAARIDALETLVGTAIDRLNALAAMTGFDDDIKVGGTDPD